MYIFDKRLAQISSVFALAENEVIVRKRKRVKFQLPVILFMTY